MSVKVMSWVWEHSESTGNDRLVLLAIADRCDDDGRNAWPSVETLARKCNMSVRTVQRCVVALTELGELAVDRQQGGSAEWREDRRPNLYRVVMRRGDSVVTPYGVTGQVRGDNPGSHGVTTLSPNTPSNTSLEPTTTARLTHDAADAPEVVAAPLSLEVLKEQALVILADRRVQAKQGCHNPVGYRDSVIRGLRGQLEPCLASIMPGEPWTAQTIADFLEPPLPPPTPTRTDFASGSGRLPNWSKGES